MSNIDNLFNRFNELAVGFGPVFRDFHTHSTRVSYPPHNIITVSDTEFLLELAVAGFKKHEITIEEHEGVLTISANKLKDVDLHDVETASYQYQGIAKRAFSKSIRVAEYFEISNATLEDGILTIKFIKNVPESGKPKLIPIK